MNFLDPTLLLAGVAVTALLFAVVAYFTRAAPRRIIGTLTAAAPLVPLVMFYDAFAAPLKGTFGSAGRNILVGPRLSQLDFSMAKSFMIPKLENGRLQIKLDSTNILNHTSFNTPNASIGSTGNVGRITGTTVSGRTIQLGARLSF